MTNNTFETTHNTLVLTDELEREREQFIDENAVAALRLELAGLALTATNTMTPEHFDD